MSSADSGPTHPTDSYGMYGSTGAEVAKAVSRVALGWTLLHQGWGKVQMELSGGIGSFYAGNQFQNSNPDWLPAFVAAPYGYALPWLELGFGVLLLLGLFNRISAGAATIIMLSIAVAWMNAGNLFPRHMLMVFVPLAAYFYFAGPGRYSLDAMRAGRAGAR